jgi:TonB-linked SusC/RagA family outer membrane protein
VAWRISREAFLKNVSILNDLKLRASYGQTGNQEGIGYYDYLKLIQLGRPYPFNYPYPFGAGLQSQAASLSGIVSTDRTWETLINRNIGVDATLLGSRLNFSFDYFIKTNRNLLIPVTYPSVLGAAAPFSNSGELRTKGFEATIGWKDRIGNLEYNARILLSDAQNKIVYYGGADTYVPGLNRIREGYPVNTYFAYVFDGVIRTQAELDAYKQLGGVPADISIGDARFRDLNGDGKISPVGDKAGDDGDVINAGSTTPRYSFGVNLGAKFKNFDISVFMQGVGKRTLFREGEYAIPWSDWWRQPPQFYYGQTWNEDRPGAYYPRLSHGSIRYWNYQPSTLQRINAAYVRLKNLQVGYSLPADLLRKCSIFQARIYFSGQDLAELHHVKGGWDPEAAANGFNYPFQRFYSFGIDVTF